MSKPTQYSKSPTDANFDLLQKVAQRKQTTYNNSNKPSCYSMMSFIVSNYEEREHAPIVSSSMLASVDYYTYADITAVIAYIKDNSYDVQGKPYIFCGISKETWRNFINSGLTNSWGKSFHYYIFDNKCNCK